MTKESFENAIVTASSIGASSNAPPHLIAIAKKLNIELTLDDWERCGENIPLLVNMQPSGEFLAESFFKAGGVPVVMNELNKHNLLHKDAKTVNGKTIDQNLNNISKNENIVICDFNKPMKEKAGFLVLRSNFFDTAIMKMSVVSSEFKARYLSDPSNPNVFIVKAIVFDGPENYHKNINNPDLNIDENSILIMRGCGPIGYPGSAEVVNMQPPDQLLKKGVTSLPCLGDGRQSGTSESPSILNVSPESAVGGGLSIIKNGDKIKIDLNNKRVDLLLDDKIIKERLSSQNYTYPENQTPWQEISRKFTGQLSDGACLDLEEQYFNIAQSKGIPRDSH
jgi:dihydroxy-acid dehydratase